MDNFYKDFVGEIKLLHPEIKTISNDIFNLIEVDNRLIFCLMTSKQVPYLQQALQSQEDCKDKRLIFLWEDVWLLKKELVLSRIKSFLGQNRKIHARQTKVVKLNKLEAQSFLNQYHIQGAAGLKYNYGLLLSNELVAVISFSAIRPIPSKGLNYSSVELVRFANRSEVNVVGGLSKLIKAFAKENKVNDVMTYIDRDWSLGHGFQKIGFIQAGYVKPIHFLVNQNTLERYPEKKLPQLEFEIYHNLSDYDKKQYLLNHGFSPAFNTGSIKMYLHL